MRVGMWAFPSGNFWVLGVFFFFPFKRKVLISLSLPPNKCFTVTIRRQQRYKVCFRVADVHLGRPPHLQSLKNTAQMWTIPNKNTHTYSYAPKLFTMCSSCLAPPLPLCSPVPFSFFSVHLQPLHPLPLLFSSISRVCLKIDDSLSLVYSCLKMHELTRPSLHPEHRPAANEKALLTPHPDLRVGTLERIHRLRYQRDKRYIFNKTYKYFYHMP